MMCFVTQGYRGVGTLYTGYAALSLSKGPMQTQVQPIIIERLPPDCGATLRARRGQAGIRLDDLPPAMAFATDRLVCTALKRLQAANRLRPPFEA